MWFFLFELFSQVSDEVHGPLVVIVIYLFWQSNVIVNRIPTIISDVDHGEMEREGLKNLHMEHLYKEEDSFFRQQHNRFVSCVYLVYFGVSSLCTVLCICIICFLHYYVISDLQAFKGTFSHDIPRNTRHNCNCS